MRAEFLFDFGSPNAWLAHAVLPGIEKRTGVRFEYRPVLLGGLFKATGNQAPMQAFGHIRNKMAYERLEMDRFIARHRIPFTFNPHFPVNTLMLMRIASGAAIDGVLSPFVDAAFRHMWVEPKKMDDPDVVRAALAGSGLDADRLMARGQDQDAKDFLLANTNEAVERGVFGAPSFFVDGDLYFGKDRLREVEDRLGQR